MSQGGFRKPAQPDTARPDVAGKAKPEDGKAEKRRTETAGNGRRDDAPQGGRPEEETGRQRDRHKQT